MTNTPEGNAADRVNRREFTQRVAQRAGVPERVAASVYSALVDELVEITKNGYSVTLSGFGRFYPQTHGGHKVRARFDNPQEMKEVEDYAVLKFSATREVNKRVSGQDKPDKKKRG
jgi:DNA-binding protein HU-beta